MYSKRQSGFTLLEALVAITIITMMSMLLVGAAGPWINLKQNMDTGRKLADFKQGILSLYNDTALEVEMTPSGTFAGVQTSATVTNDGYKQCVAQTAPLQAVSSRFSEGFPGLELDGHKNPFCFFVSPTVVETMNGVNIPYRSIAIVSTGPDGTLDAATQMVGQNLTLGGDDVGVTVSGRDIQRKKLEETQKRLSKIGMMYETYFTTRFLSYADRDITRFYFSSEFDPKGFILSTGGNWFEASLGLTELGVTGALGFSAWEPVAGVSNHIQYNNSRVNDASTIQPRTPHTSGVGGLPYTVVFRARVPSTSPAEVRYVTHVAVGGY